MGTLRHRKQIILFLAAVLVPSLTLVFFTVRIVRQEKELATKRMADVRERRAQEIGRDLLVRLERIIIEEARSEEVLSIRPAAYRPSRPEVIFLGLVEEGHLYLPWEQPPCAVGGSRVRNLRALEILRAGEKAEFERKDPALAAGIYRQVIATGGVEGDDARLLLARVLVKSGNTAEAFMHYRSLLALPAERIDEDGIPLFLYAADRLANTPEGAAATAARIEEDLKKKRWMSPLEAALVDSILFRVSRQEVPDRVKSSASGLRDLLRPYAAEAAHLSALQKGFPGYVFRLGSEGSPPSSGSTWEVEPKGDWILGLVELRPGREGLLAVDIEGWSGSLSRDREFRQAYPENIVLTAAELRPGESLGPKLKGLNIIFSDPPALSTAAGAASTRPLYTLVMIAAVMFASLGGYLLWRDVQRELGLAELRSQFASSVSHELKTPLTAIRMFAETARMGRLGSEEARDEYLDTIINESERLSRLLNNVLDVSKIEQGKKLYRPSFQPLAPIVRTAARTMEYPLRQKGFTLRVDVEDGLPDVRVDADALEQALLNLIGNAIKYSADSREIGLRLVRRGPWAVVRVSDEGLGIPPRERQRIFEKYYRIASRENEEIPGTGLGLSLVAHFVQAHGGRVEVDGGPGEGSVFSIFLPIEEVR